MDAAKVIMWERLEGYSTSSKTMQSTNPRKKFAKSGLISGWRTVTWTSHPK